MDARSGHVIVTGNADAEQTVKAVSEVAQGVAGVRDVDCEAGVGSNGLW